MARKKLSDVPDDTDDTSSGLYFASNNRNVNFIHSGSKLLDCVLGGGWAIGRIVNIVGDKSTGKTLLAMEAVANFLSQYPNGQAYYVETEAAFDKGYAEALGVPVKKLNFIEDLFTVEDLFESLDKLMGILDKEKSDVPVLFIVDSLDALSDRAELDREIDKGSFGAAKAKKMSELFRKLNKRLSTHRFCVMVISQVRDNIGVTFGRKVTRSGGRALDFYASQVIYLAQLKTHKKTKNKVERPIGVRVKAKCDKNKVALPFRECEFDIMFGYGVDDLTANIEWLEAVSGLDRLTGKDKKTYLREVQDLPDPAYFEELDRVAEAVDDLWREVETTFLPTRQKRRGIKE